MKNFSSRFRGVSEGERSGRIVIAKSALLRSVEDAMSTHSASSSSKPVVSIQVKKSFSRCWYFGVRGQYVGACWRADCARALQHSGEEVSSSVGGGAGSFVVVGVVDFLPKPKMEDHDG